MAYERVQRWFSWGWLTLGNYYFLLRFWGSGSASVIFEQIIFVLGLLITLWIIILYLLRSSRAHDLSEINFRVAGAKSVKVVTLADIKSIHGDRAIFHVSPLAIMTFVMLSTCVTYGGIGMFSDPTFVPSASWFYLQFTYDTVGYMLLLFFVLMGVTVDLMMHPTVTALFNAIQRSLGSIFLIALFGFIIAMTGGIFALFLFMFIPYWNYLMIMRQGKQTVVA